MKLPGIVRFELACQVRRPWPWLFFGVLLAITFLMARDAALVDALYTEYFANSPFAVAVTTVVGGLVWLLVAPAVAGEAAARDVATGMDPLAWTVPVGKSEYLGGRFLAALLLNAALLLAVQAGILLGVYTAGAEAASLGPFRPAAHLTAYAFLSLPGAFVATALQFAAAARSGRPMAAYLGSLFLVFMGFFVASFVGFFLDRDLGSLLDPVGISFVVDDLAHSWTSHEKSWRLLALEGTLLHNRLLWLGVGFGALAVTWLGFRFEHRTEGHRWGRRRRESRSPTPARLGVSASAPISVPRVARTSGFVQEARATFAFGWTSFRAIARSRAGLALLVVLPLLTVLVVLDQMSFSGVPLIPGTARVVAELTAPLTAELSRWVIVPLFFVFFAGELVWRERDAGLDEIVDAMPVSGWAPLLGKLLGLALVLAAFTAMQTIAGMAAQAILGHTEFEIGLYLKILFGLQLPEYLLFAALALAVHVVVDQKHVGHLVAILAYAFITVLAGTLGIEHDLLVYGAAPGWSYTEMRGFGASVGPWLWFELYWAAWALLLVVAARLLRVRGKEGRFGARLRLARRRFTGGTVTTAAVAAALVVSLGGFVFYDTNVRNEYLSSSEVAERRAEYERRYRRYENLPQPRLTEADLRVEIHPEARRVEIRGSYRLANGGDAAIDSVHVSTSTAKVETRRVTLDRAATLAVDDAERGYRIYALETPLQPGDTLRLDFEVRVERRGFGNDGIDPSVAASGTAFTNAWFPAIGYQRFRELLGPGERREHGLPPRPVLASLEEDEGRPVAARGGGVRFEAVVGTVADQVAVAPGELRRTWTQGGRRWFHYAASAPIGDEWAFFSADYAVREGRWNDVAIRIFHHPEHTGHLDRTMRSARASLDYYTRQFGPCPYRHLSIVEHPVGSGVGAHADPALISHGQGFARLAPREGRLDLPFYVMAHEMAHQWTLPYALVEGLPFLAEGLATYSAIQVVRESLGEAQFRRLLAFMREPWPYRPIRRGEPLLQALDPYLSRRRGPLAMVALSEYVGEDRVNGAIRRLIETHDAPGAPPATTLDLHRELRAVTPDSLGYLLHDLFEVNALWHLETERATAEPIGDGAWRVTLDVRARKTVYEATGEVREVPMDEWVPIGVFAGVEEGEEELSAPLHVEKHRVRSGEQTITVTVPSRPVLAGIDPYHLLDWEERGDDDNVERVEIEHTETGGAE